MTALMPLMHTVSATQQPQVENPWDGMRNSTPGLNNGVWIQTQFQRGKHERAPKALETMVALAYEELSGSGETALETSS